MFRNKAETWCASGFLIYSTMDIQPQTQHNATEMQTTDQWFFKMLFLEILYFIIIIM